MALKVIATKNNTYITKYSLESSSFFIGQPQQSKYILHEFAIYISFQSISDKILVALLQFVHVSESIN